MQTIKAVAYARFSTDMQRDESIDAQLRAIQYYADKYNYEIVGVYADKAKSGRTSDRPQFLQMIADSAKGGFQAVIVHKLDRFSRDSADTLIYERELNKNGVELVSVNERLEKTPEGLLMKQIIIGMNQFYSANLAREVMKGLKENAYNGKHTGGTPPLGYDVGEDMRYVINKKEAEAVKIIFSMYTDGCGYGDIIRELNSRGYRTKINNRFTKNSLYEILRNEKYTGVFIYNKSSSIGANGRFNRHKYKNSDDIIRIEGAVPQIITKEMFDMAQEILDRNKRKKSTYKAKTFYLLGGLLECGSCGASLCGETHRYRNKEYSYYVCVGKKRKHNCTVSNINRDYLDTAVLDELNDVLFSKKNIELICDRIYSSYNNGDEYVQKTKRDLEANIRSLNRKINNLYNAMENGLNANETTKRINAPIVTALFDEKEANTAPFCEQWRLLQNVNDSVYLFVRRNALNIEYRPMLIYTFYYELKSNKRLSRVKKFDLMYSTPDEIDNMADKLRFYRHQNNLSQNDLAHLLNVDRTVYAKYESRKTDYYPIDRMQKIADFYHILITDLLDEYNLFIYHGQAEGFKQLRKSLCLSLSDVAERLNVNLATVKRWSQEITRLPKSALEQLLDMKKAVNR